VVGRFVDASSADQLERALHEDGRASSCSVARMARSTCRARGRRISSVSAGRAASGSLRAKGKRNAVSSEAPERRSAASRRRRPSAGRARAAG